MKSLTGGLIFRHSRLQRTGTNRALQSLVKTLSVRLRCGCTTSPGRRLLECSLKEEGLTRGSYQIPAAEASASRSLCVAAARHQRCLSVDVGLYAKGHRRRHPTAAARSPASRAVVHVAHADECAQNVFRTDIGAYLAGRDGAVQQSADGFGQAIERIGVEFRRALHGKRQRRPTCLFWWQRIRHWIAASCARRRPVPPHSSTVPPARRAAPPRAD